ncbi:MAG TPA: long-chain-fatty-acid--CoA ligase [Mycobacteriales bacterium]|jgi:acyl-CoA synthetase (AMP-forming)/AMP-acid ligase II|nr:long-chain-fatty-acid--CoA ligase [Mycobacteriales bacterium]
MGVQAGTEAFPRTARAMTLGAVLSRTTATYPDRVAYRCGAEQRTYAELDARVDRLAAALRSRGVGPGDRVAVLMKNRLEVVETYWAGCRLGAIVVPLNFRLVPEEVAYVLTDCGPTATVVDADLAPVLQVVRSAQPGLGGAVLALGGSAHVPDADDYEAALAAGAGPVAVDVDENDPAFLMYTSGTTGRPKGAVLSHLNLMMNAFNMLVAQRVGAGEDHVWLSGLPLFHIAGLSGVLPYLVLGGTSVIVPSGDFSAADTLDLLAAERVTACFFVPTQWQALCAEQSGAPRELSLRIISWGASPAPPSVLQAMAEVFPDAANYNAFGQTEMSPVTCLLMGEDALRKMGSVGRPVVDVEARIVDDAMNDVPVGQVGEIVYRGPTTFLGYWNRPDANQEAFEGGWFHSGDLCRMDEEGFIYVVDRKKDMIISGGENIYCSEVEVVIDRHPKVSQVAVVGLPHEKWVETPAAFVVAADPADPPSEAEVLAFCREHLASYKKPTVVRVVDELPRNASGKVRKTVLRDLLKP